MVTIVPLKTPVTRQFYATQAAQDGWSVRELSNQIERKAFECTEIASTQVPALPAAAYLCRDQLNSLSKRTIATEGQQQLFSGSGRSNVEQARLLFLICTKGRH
jgi:predicted nuclease of restriction endonuclease-like (RecB) superfamily